MIPDDLLLVRGATGGAEFKPGVCPNGGGIAEQFTNRLAVRRQRFAAEIVRVDVEFVEAELFEEIIVDVVGPFQIGLFPTTFRSLIHTSTSSANTSFRNFVSSSAKALKNFLAFIDSGSRVRRSDRPSACGMAQERSWMMSHFPWIFCRVHEYRPRVGRELSFTPVFAQMPVSITSVGDTINRSTSVITAFSFGSSLKRFSKYFCNDFLVR